MGDPSLFITSNISLENVWICTTHPDNEPLTVTQDLGTGGCLGGSMDTGFPKHIVANRVPDQSVVKGNVILYRPFVNKTIQFSFPIEYTVERTQLYVHVQSTIDINPGTSRRRLLQDGSGSNTAHFAGSVGITNGPVVEEEEDIGMVSGINKDVEKVPGYAVALIAAIVTSLICICGFMVIGTCYRKISARNARNGSDSLSAYKM